MNNKGARAPFYMTIGKALNLSKPSPRGEGVDQRETDEGITFLIDTGFGKAVCLPRIKEKSHTLCLDDLSTNLAPHPTRRAPSHLLLAGSGSPPCPSDIPPPGVPRGEGFISAVLLCFKSLCDA